MSVIDWVLSLSPHELDVIRTIGGFLAAITSTLAAVATVYSRLAYKNAKEAKQQTQLAMWNEGQLHSVSVAELANRIHGDTAGFHDEFRSEITDLVNDPRSGTGPVPRIHGRRRDPHRKTDEVPRIRPNPDESSLYTGIESESTDHE